MLFGPGREPAHTEKRSILILAQDCVCNRVIGLFLGSFESHCTLFVEIDENMIDLELVLKGNICLFFYFFNVLHAIS